MVIVLISVDDYASLPGKGNTESKGYKKNWNGVISFERNDCFLTGNLSVGCCTC